MYIEGFWITFPDKKMRADSSYTLHSLQGVVVPNIKNSAMLLEPEGQASIDVSRKANTVYSCGGCPADNSIKISSQPSNVLSIDDTDWCS